MSSFLKRSRKPRDPRRPGWRLQALTETIWRLEAATLPISGLGLWNRMAGIGVDRGRPYSYAEIRARIERAEHKLRLLRDRLRAENRT